MRSTDEYDRDSVLQDLESADEEVRRLPWSGSTRSPTGTFCRDSRSGWGIPTGACARPRDIPVVVITTEGANEDRDRALELGANEYLCKPIQANKVLSVVKRFLQVE